MTTATVPPSADWSTWTVILLKPDCLRRNLVGPVLASVERAVAVVSRRTLLATAEQAFAHYDDMLPLSADLGVDVRAELRRIYNGQPVTVALGHGPDATVRTRAILGHTDPAFAAPDTIRGRFGTDSLAAARAQNRLIDNLIHSSDHPGIVARDLAIWLGRKSAPSRSPSTNSSGRCP